MNAHNSERKMIFTAMRSSAPYISKTTTFALEVISLQRSLDFMTISRTRIKPKGRVTLISELIPWICVKRTLAN